MGIDILTIGDAMVTFEPGSHGPMRYVHTFERKAGGAELNVAIGAARLGLKSSFISRFGNDEFGKYMLNFVRGEGVDVSNVALVDEYPTSVYFKEVMADGSGRSFFYRDRSPTEVLTIADIDENVIKQSKIVYLTGVFMALDPKNIDIAIEMAKLARKHGKKVAFDPNIRLRLWSKDEAKEAMLRLLPHVDFVFSGEEEAAILFGVQSITNYIKKFHDYGAEIAVIKRGAEGSVASHNGDVISTKAIPVDKVVDTVGAGDAYNAGFLYMLLSGKGLPFCVEFAAHVASIVVTVAGDNDGLPYLPEVEVAIGIRDEIER